MTCETEFQWTSASRSHVGLIRQINEDSILDRAERGLWAVADGMGGHALGDVASRMIVDALASLPPSDSLAQTVAGVHGSLQAVNRLLLAEAALRNARVIGSTVVVLTARERYCTFIWAGDSRAYLYRNGQLRQLTRDHSQVEELKSIGSITSEDALHHPARNLITRAVGATDTLDLDEETIEVDDGDVFLLCSDGLSNEVSEQEMQNILAAGDCLLAAEALVDMALQGGGHDNISVVVVHARDMYSTEKTVLNPSL